MGRVCATVWYMCTCAAKVYARKMVLQSTFSRDPPLYLANASLPSLMREYVGYEKFGQRTERITCRVEQFVKKRVFIAWAVVQVVLSRDGVIWNNRRCTEASSVSSLIASRLPRPSMKKGGCSS
jgi:hypothetical protein